MDKKETAKNIMRSPIKVEGIPALVNDLQLETRRRFLYAIEKGSLALEKRELCSCGSNDRTQLAYTDRFGLPFGSFLCEACGLIFTSPFISKQSVSLYYQDFYHLLHFGSHPTPGKVLYAKGQGAKIFNHVKDRLKKKDIKVLEIGSGTGSVIKEFCMAAVDAGFSISGTGLEYSKEYVDRFEPKGLDIRMLKGGVDALPQLDGLFDLVIMSHVFEHFPEPDSELEAIRGFINPDALLYIEVPGIFSLRYRYHYNCEFIKYLTCAHVFNFNLHSLTGLLNRSGFLLLWGNEEVESIFTLGKQSIDTSGNADLIKEYLKDLELNHLFYTSLSTENLKDRLGIEKIEQAIDIVDQIRSSLPYRFIKRFARVFRSMGIIK